MENNKLKEMLKNKNTLLIIAVFVLFILFLLVFLRNNKVSNEVAVSDEPKNSLLEPISEDEKVHSKSGKKYIFPMVFHSEDLAVCGKIPEQALWKWTKERKCLFSNV